MSAIIGIGCGTVDTGKQASRIVKRGVAKKDLSVRKPRRLSVDKTAPFETGSYIGTDIAQFKEDGEKPPRTAKLVVSLYWSWAPGTDVSATYFLSTNRKRTGWFLWERGYDDYMGKTVYCRVAWGAPYRGYSAKYVAKRLLAEAWLGELK
jgi:hypothetical protein